ncbi:hypothetical protein, partial [Maliponia aquimaris]|uniref:hypothetical protein n=1 Tax=Maliponia aquimaris TaxID=1673631 RepID=UPI001C3D8E07
MASFNIIGFSTTTQVLNVGELGVITPGSTLVVYGNYAVGINDFGDLVNLGAIVTTPISVFVSRNGTVTVGAQGSITSTTFNAVGLGGYGGLRQIVNNGAITGYFSGIEWGAIVHGTDIYQVRLVNTGTIIGQTGQGAQIAVEGGATPGLSVIDNSGTISGLTSGLKLDGVTGAGGAFRIVNSGLIEGRSGAAITQGFGPSLTIDIVNSGRILS